MIFIKLPMFTSQYGKIYQLAVKEGNLIEAINIHNYLNMYIYDYWQLCKKHNWIQMHGSIFFKEEDLKNILIDLTPYLNAANVARKLMKII